MAELGQTTDPRALVPGTPETIDADAAAFTVHGKRVEQVGTRLRSVTVGDWDGLAGARFAQMWVGEPPRWLKVVDAIGAATAAMYAYAGMVRWAQGQAAGAITLWEQADALTRQATASYQVAADEAAADCRYIEPFADPGEALRREAQDLLARARDQLRAAGDQAARAITGSGPAPPVPPGRVPGSALDSLKDALTGSANGSGSFSAGGVNGQGGIHGEGRVGFSGLSYGAETSGPDVDEEGLTLGEVKAHAHLFDASASGSLSAGGFQATGTSSAGFGGDMSASASITEDGLEAHLTASDGLRAAAEAKGSYGILGVRAAGEASAGLNGTLGLDATPKKIGLNLEGFTGAKVAGDVGADLGGIEVGLHSEAWAGVGAKLDGGYEFKGGKFHLHGHIGAALGVGGSEGFDITIDPDKVGHTAMQAADSLGRGLDDVGRGARDAVGAIGNGIGGAAHHLGL